MHGGCPDGLYDYPETYRNCISKVQVLLVCAALLIMVLALPHLFVLELMCLEGVACMCWLNHFQFTYILPMKQINSLILTCTPFPIMLLCNVLIIFKLVQREKKVSEK